MKKQVSVLTLYALLYALCLPIEAQQAKMVPRVGLLIAGSSATMASRVEAFSQGLRELGYAEGQSIAIEVRYSEGKLDRIKGFAAELVHSKVDVIVTFASSVTQEVKETTSTIPIVMAGGGGDPVRDGLIASLAKPGGNITGVTTLNQELTGKQLELLKEAFPKVSRVAAVWNPAAPGPTHGFKQLQSAALPLAVQIQSLEVRKRDDIDQVFAGVDKKRVDALFVLSNPLININRVKVLGHVGKSRLPAMYPERRWVEDGGLMAYGTDVIDLARRAAIYVHKILKGAKPADLPVEQPAKFELVINLKTAKQLGLPILPNVLARADKVIR